MGPIGRTVEVWGRRTGRIVPRRGRVGATLCVRSIGAHETARLAAPEHRDPPPALYHARRGALLRSLLGERPRRVS
jgi:hypothetical protein